mmetsp:Transcript_148143/g.475789  ORF Transcript_148143/g.475789 Transcript_148143/m.475789 type:complete len:93 (-) Transcript_148143:1069-1347(-)
MWCRTSASSDTAAEAAENVGSGDAAEARTVGDDGGKAEAEACCGEAGDAEGDPESGDEEQPPGVLEPPPRALGEEEGWPRAELPPPATRSCA